MRSLSLVAVMLVGAFIGYIFVLIRDLNDSVIMIHNKGHSIEEQFEMSVDKLEVLNDSLMTLQKELLLLRREEEIEMVE